ncbi:hypothetical protein [Paracoccus sp. J39]|uniref:hypothetical protein n=1 Tax=Paracoccus sp. J39 TaxID=935848 RepID=UPI0012EC067F|nr:hypothetical protein [Paracoccus sp. J39]
MNALQLRKLKGQQDKIENKGQRDQHVIDFYAIKRTAKHESIRVTISAPELVALLQDPTASLTAIKSVLHGHGELVAETFDIKGRNLLLASTGEAFEPSNVEARRCIKRLLKA